jgi:benzoyl-CoA reductase/2-hydroxyglutaryl-CoA dehydratase subunit BcrC/BadD/HgdB
MEPVTTTAMIGTVVGYLAKKFSDSKSFQDFTNDFSDSVVKWIKPIFLKEDEKPKEVLENLQKKPDSQPRQDAVKAAIATELEDNPNANKLLEEMIATINKKKAEGKSISISNSKNVNTGNINAGGSVIFGDNNQITK